MSVKKNLIQEINFFSISKKLGMQEPSEKECYLEFNFFTSLILNMKKNEFADNI